MLILSRKEGEGVNIGDNISVKVVEINDGVVKLGFEAPEEIMILRDELKNDVKEANIKSNEQNSIELLLGIRDKLL